ncbi:LytR/AlgR family response regulator transcription factor [Bacteroidota bacterium]
MKTSYRSIIVDDEELARADLKIILDDFKEIEIIGEAESVEEAKLLINELKPDLIFLDIQMPGKSGFDLLEEIETSAKIIFITAYDEYAIRAFEVSAKDYLLKPVNKKRLSLALEHLNSDQEDEVDNKKKFENNDNVFLMVNNHYKFIKIATITKIAAAGNYSEIHTSSKIKGLVLKSLKYWESKLPDNSFVRIHRKTIINLDYVSHVEEWFNYSYKVYLKEIDEPLVISRRYASKLKARMI